MSFDANSPVDCYKSMLTLNSKSEEKVENQIQSSDGIEQKLNDFKQWEQTLMTLITDKDMTLAKMANVCQQYQTKIEELITEKEQIISNYERELSEIKAEHEINKQHLNSLEMTFSQLHVKYDKSKQMTNALKENEGILIGEKKILLEIQRSQEERCDKLKIYTSQQQETANEQIESVTKEKALELANLKMSLKKEEIQRASMQKQLQQKTIETCELTKVFDG